MWFGQCVVVTDRYSLPCCRLREHHRAAVRVIRRMQYFVAKKKFQVSLLSQLALPASLALEGRPS